MRKSPKIFRSDKKAWDLVIQHEGWLRRQITRHGPRLRSFGIDTDDLVQEVRIAAFSAARYWDREKAAFTTYVDYWIRSAIGICKHQHFFWSSKDHSRCPKLMHIGDATAEEFERRLDAPTEPRDPEQAAIDAAALNHIELLPERLQYTMKEWLAGETLASTAKKMGLTRERVRQLRLIAVDKLRSIRRAA